MASRQKAHIGLNVRNVDRSAKFYRAMFGIEPVKWKPGYAKFDIDEPPLNLTLNYSDKITDRGALNHLGIEVETTAAVLAAKERLQKAGLATQDEMNVDCCFALQDKVWVSDPDGNRWEVFTVKVGDTQPELQVSPVELETSQHPKCCSPAIP